MDTWKRFTSEELRIARSASITNVARALGFTPVKMGQTWTTLKEHDSVIIKNDLSYSRNSVTTSSGKKEGGTAIDFVKNFTGNNNLVEVVQYICELEGYTRKLPMWKKAACTKKWKPGKRVQDLEGMCQKKRRSLSSRQRQTITGFYILI